MKEELKNKTDISNIFSIHLGIYKNKKELRKVKANVGDMAYIKDYAYRLIKQPYYVSSNWIKFYKVEKNMKKIN